MHGALGLAFDAVEGLADIVEGMHRNIAVGPLGAVPTGAAPGIAGFVYSCVRGVNGLLRDGLASTAHAGDESRAPDERWLAVLNGIIGDHLERTGNPLAIPMDVRAGGLALRLERSKLRAALPEVRDRVLLLVHGLCMSDRRRSNAAGSIHDHGEALVAALDGTLLRLRYNSGRHVSTNGRELASLLAQLDAEWPMPLRAITLVGHSMGGLVIRSALHVAHETGAPWLSRVDRAVYLGTPHHGAALERAGNRLHAALGVSRYVAPLADLATVRSAGITDLRHGNVVEADWRGRDDRFADHADRRQPTPLTPGPRHVAIAATLSEDPHGPLGRLLGDGLVDVASATGRHADPRRSLEFDPADVHLVPRTGHLELLSSGRVYAALEGSLRA